MTSDTPLPRSVRRGPQITLTCECGAQHRLHYGQRWHCETCGRTWDTNRIPMEQYAAIRATQLRYRRVPIAISVVALLCVVAAVIAGRAVGGVLIIAIVATTWSMFFRPLHRRKYRQALGELPSWEIKPE